MLEKNRGEVCTNMFKKHLYLLFGEDIIEGIIQLLFVGAGFLFVCAMLIMLYL